jgi:hypothetical protein
MFLKYSGVLLFILFYFNSSAQRILGVVTDTSGVILPFSSVEVKGRNIFTTANVEGKFSISIPPGTYTLVCQHVGYERQEKQVEVGQENISVEIRLKNHEGMLTEVIVQQGEDPAYEIIRNAIRKRPEYKKDLDKFTVEVYTKGQLRLRDFPKKFMGEKVDFEDGDSSKKKILFLSEAVAKYSVEKPDHHKVEVIASKVSGQADAYGLSAPNLLSFYENNIRMGNISPRGFISPVAENALNYYKYKYEGAFYEDGRQISRIRVIPRRKFEPVYSGYINIVEDEWRIHSLQLEVTKDYGIQFFDTIRLEQLHIPVGNIWVVKSQVVYPAIKMFGFDAHGSFANVYSNYDLSPQFPKGYFTSTVMKYADSSNKRPEEYWEVNRPIVLQTDEVEDYRKKDSLEHIRKSPAYRDSIDREDNKIKPSEIFLTGVSFRNSKKHSSVSIAPLIESLSYNTVEGTAANLKVTYSKRLDTTTMGRRAIAITPEVRYGFGNEHLNPRLSLQYFFGPSGSRMASLQLSGGSDVFQFSNENPVNVFHNTVSTLFYGKNFLKIYEAGFVQARYAKGIADGVYFTLQSTFMNRTPLENTTEFMFGKYDSTFTPNYPLPLANYNIPHHQSMEVMMALRWQPGTKFIEFPEQKVSLGSKYPFFTLVFTQGIKNVFSSDVDYSKWMFRVNDNLNFRMLGAFNYRFDLGGFLRRKSVPLPDHIHFKGNTTDVAGSFGDRFLLVPHYYFSTTTRFYSAFFTEHHFNGFITNKIPGIKQLKWNLVGGARGIYTQAGKRYVEPFIGLENIFKVIRVDYVWGFEKDGPTRGGLRFGMSSPFFRN